MAIGALTGVAAAFVLTDPNEDPHLGWALLMTTVTCALAPALMRVGHRRDALNLGPVREGSGHRGITFPNFRASVFAASGCAITMGAAAIMLSRSTDPGAGGDPILLACGLLLLVSPLLLVWRGWNKGFVLTEQAIILTQRGRTQVVPWEAILGVIPHQYGKGGLAIRLLLKDGARRVARVPFLSRTRLDLWVAQQVNDPALLLHAVLHYLTTPENRHELAGTAALERLSHGELPSAGKDGMAIV